MKNSFPSRIKTFGRLVTLLLGLTRILQAADRDLQTLGPVGATKAFHGTIRARDLQLGTVSLGSGNHISRVLALDPYSRLFKGTHPASLADFSTGDLLEGYVFPDQRGRMVIAVATAQPRPLSAQESKSPKSRKSSRPKGSRSGGKSNVAPEIPAIPPGPEPFSNPGKRSPATVTKSAMPTHKTPNAIKQLHPRAAPAAAKK